LLRHASDDGHAVTVSRSGSSPASTVTSDLEELGRLREDRARLEAELDETNRGVVALYAELEDQAERIRRADEMKSRFLSRVSHELRTPINSVLALSRLLADRVDGELSEGQATQVGFIETAAEELSRIVNDLLDLARIESGRVEVRVEPFELDALFATLRGTLRPLARPGVSLVFAPVDEVPTIRTDEGKLGQILRNFVSNALKFTASGEVVVTARWDEPTGRVRIEVRDTGIGIQPEDLERIFDEFTQVAGDHQIGLRGTGLGLPVSRGLARLLGGDVGVASVPGAGSTFWVDIPGRDVDVVAPLELQSASSRAAASILVIDDDSASRYVTERHLEAQGYTMIAAATGSEGLTRARDHRPAAIVLDLSLPDLDGVDVLARLRKDRATSSIPVIVHSGRVLGTLEERQLSTDAAAIVPKGAGADQLAGAISAALRARRTDA
jgi:signal transduction histidine kinase/ActR/RegA family two-component response regulator